MLIHASIVAETPALRERIARLVAHPDVIVAEARSARRDRLEQESPDLVLITRAELAAPIDQAVRRLIDLPERPAVIVLVAREDPEERAALLGLGCRAVLYLGLVDEALTSTLSTLIQRLQEEVLDRARLRGLESAPRLDDLVSSSPVMRNVKTTARRVATTDTALLVLGETGVGKEWLARAIHAAGSRTAGPFVAVNCAAVPEHLLESEFFGHERGAFTGAVRSRRGHFELAHRGTLFLDEIGELPLHLQAKLLRVLQEHTIQPVGSERSVAVDLRIVAATNRDLAADHKAGRFRSDLFYRLSVVTVTIPPLRDRREDIPVLVEACRKHFTQALRRPVHGVDPAALAALTAYAWPGNVREMFNVMERAVLLCHGEAVTLADLPDDVARPRRPGEVERAGGPSLSDGWLERPWKAVRAEALDLLERAYFTELLRRTSGRIGEAARKSEMDSRSLFEKLRRHGIRKETFRAGMAVAAADGVVDAEPSEPSADQVPSSDSEA
jgi:DNA-binding NtrC family response regulator